MAQRLAEAIECGWGSAEAKAQVAAVAEFLQIPARDAEVAIAANARLAARVAGDFGAGVAAPLIPSVPAGPDTDPAP